MSRKRNPTHQHIKALVRKNWILFKRSCCCSCCEILLPIIFAFLLLIIRNRIPKNDIPETSYIGEFQSIALPVFPMNNNSVVALAPDCEITNMIENTLLAKKMHSKYFTNSQEIDDYVRNGDYGETSDRPQLTFGIVFDNYEVGNYEYALRFNASGNNPITNPSSFGVIAKYYPENYDEVKKFVTSGFLYIQSMVDSLIYSLETNKTLTEAVLITSVKVPAYVQDQLSNRLQDTAQVYVVFPWIVLFLRFLYRLLYEKERKITEGMRMMGMNNSALYVSWFLTYGLISFISVLLTSLLFKVFFKNSNFLILFLWEWLFVLCLLSQAFFVSVFFTRPRSGIMAGLVFFFVQYYVNQMVSASSDATMQIKTVASIAPHAAMSFASGLFVSYETLGVGVDFSTINEEMNNYKVSICFGMVIMNFLVYLILAIYLDQVIPNEFGKKKHPLFFLDFLRSSNSKLSKQITPKNHKKIELAENDNSKIQILKEDQESEGDIVEPVDANLKQQEQQRQTLNIRHLSKVYSNGKQAVSDLSLTMYQGQIFALLGHNGAGKTTTISILTGLIEASSGEASVFGIDVLNNMDEIRHFMGVCPQHDILFDQLTVREHLVLFGTFKGVPKSELTEAVDQMIKDIGLEDKRDFKAKNLSGGQKRKLSVGIAYIGDSKLILLDEPTSGMDTSARRFVWEMLKNNKSEKIVILTTHFMDEADFLGDRIAIMSSGALKCCGSSIFLKNRFGIGYNLIIVKKSTKPAPEINNLVLGIIPKANLLSDVSAEISFQLPLNEMPRFAELFKTLDEKKHSMGIHSYGVSITTLEEVFLKVAEGDIHHRKLDENAKDANYEALDDFELKNIILQSGWSLFWLRFWALVVKRLRYFRRDLRGIIAEIFMPIIVIIVGLCLMLIVFISDPGARLLELNELTGKSLVLFSGGNSATMSQYLPQMVYPTFFDSQNLSLWNDELYALRTPDSSFAAQTLGGYFFQEFDASTSTYGVFIEGDTRITDSFAILLNVLDQTLLRLATGVDSKNIRVWNAPFPMTQMQANSKKNISAIFAVFIFSIGMALIPASLIVFIVKEKQYNIKHQQLVSGAGLFSYWTSNLFVDWVKVLVPTVFSVLMCKAFDISALIDGDCFAATWLLFIFFGFSIIAFTYLMSFLFKDYGSAQTVAFIINFLLGGIVPLIFFILRMLDDKTKSISLGIAMILRLFPSFAFGFGILNVSERALYASNAGEKSIRDPFDTEIAGYDIYYLIVLSFVYFLLVFVVEKLMLMPSCSKFFTREANYPHESRPYDSDVQKERESALKNDPGNYPILVRELRKVFSSDKSNFRVAVDSISFAIPNGECFGLLGVNGAGKTTTFKMLCGEIAPSSGQVYIAGMDLYQNLSQIRQNIGYCPQFDALLDLLTSREHLELFAALKGIPSAYANKLIDKKLNEMNLLPFENVCAGTYSGGNKRKLSVALAMLGNPPIVFLDEPSTGMDPEARRFMWTVISRISSQRKRSTIILTTHSMEEAEALSNRMAIMVNGNFECLGSIQHIKNKFGNGYELELKLVTPKFNEYEHYLNTIMRKPETRVYRSELDLLLGKMGKPMFVERVRPGGSGAHIAHDIDNPNGIAVEVLLEYVVCEERGENILAFLRSEFGETKIIEHFQTFFRFKLKADVSIGRLFASFEENKLNMGISQYSIKQATIEQIFNMFAAGQISVNQEENEQNLRRKSSSLTIFNEKKEPQLILEDLSKG